MCVTVSKTAISLALQRARKHASVGLFGCICRVRTEDHMSPCHVLFIYYCIWHGKKFLGSERVATSLRTYGVKNVKHPWSKMVSPMTQRRFHVTCSHMLLCVPTRKSVRLVIQITCLVSSHTQQCDYRLTDTETYIGLGRMCNISVSALGPDSMLGQHIFDVNSWHSCLLLLFCTLFPCICLSLTDLPNFTPFQNVEYLNKSRPFFGTIYIIKIST